MAEIFSFSTVGKKRKKVIKVVYGKENFKKWFLLPKNIALVRFDKREAVLTNFTQDMTYRRYIGI